MAHDNDSFIREVNDELRSEQISGFWRRFRPFIIGGAVVIVLGTAGFRGYEYWHAHNASVYGDQFLSALNLAKDGKTDEALAALDQLEQDGGGAYPVLAQLRSATLLSQKGDKAGAVAAFKAVSTDTNVPEVLRDLAKMRAAWILIDTGTYDQVSAEVEVMATPNHALRHSAREALGLSAFKAGDLTKAKEWFQMIADDAEAPRNIANRAQIMLDTIAASGKAAS
ncbi:tetratricopeptide repeat protein [Rhizobium sp. SSA_523]|uniref:tetratricopeptide repeat protein n=1 Tax=Rhizobium sp. SSA_523 TaxID=2952477 RepID=UPI0020918E56|nr:tetratricopeptide repeat protein [Rhizobium sp. SSA_523]MCO5730496.1 tetratricopeptide repeat protein [Rhizobium sp. SSA_523]WKC25535.1 tetratricopeptide repeat protein [Rhizobium sp. SSA_523]